MDEGEAFIRDAAMKRGIDPDIAVRVANSEGGTMPPGNVGKFVTGRSFWQFQLHYGGPEYPQFGTVAGMGIGFTKLTGWQPGDPAAWRDSIRYGLNRARLSGWTPWYGAAHVGIGKWDGIDTSNDWDAASEQWDYETGGSPVPTPRVTFNAQEPTHLQEDSFDCSQESLEWSLYAMGRTPQENWLEPTMIAEGVMTPEFGLMDASGAGLAAFVRRHYGEYGYDARNNGSVNFDDVRSVAGTTAVMIGARGWGSSGHWTGLRGYDAGTERLLLANPATGPTYGQTSLSRQEFNARGPWSMVLLTHPDVTAAPVEPSDPRDTRIAALEAQVAGLVSTLSYLTRDVSGALQAATDELKRHAPAA